LVDGPFGMLSRLRKQQPNATVGSYRYDAAGSFWRYADIRADAGRLPGAELACVMYCELEQPVEQVRDHDDLAAALRAWLQHRHILDRVKFPNGGHGAMSIAPWMWMHSYRTTLEAAQHLQGHPELKVAVQQDALRAFFKHMEFRHEPILGEKAWIIGGDNTKELHDSCQLLDGLNTLRGLFGSRVELLNKAAASPEKSALSDAIGDRVDDSFLQLHTIHSQYPYDAWQAVEALESHFTGHPRHAEFTRLRDTWKKELPPLPPWHALGQFPVERPAATSDLEAWEKVLTPLPPPESVLAKINVKTNAVRGTWTQVAGQLISPQENNARIQLPLVPDPTSYRFETEFTRLDGDCIAVMFPVGDTSALLVISGWGGKVSGLAYVNGKDANRNPTTRDGALKNDVRHRLALSVAVEEGQATVDVQLNDKPYLNWKGSEKALLPDRDWRLRNARSLGLGAYSATVIFHRASLMD